jgi:hypothetical protein
VEVNLGPINIWVNNAMAAVLSPIKAMTAQEFKRVPGGFAAPCRPQKVQTAVAAVNERVNALRDHRGAVSEMPGGKCRCVNSEDRGPEDWRRFGCHLISSQRSSLKLT